MFEPKPERNGRDAALYGWVLFAYLTRGVINNAPVFGMLSLDELELTLHASSNLLAFDAAPIAIERFAFVRKRIALSIEYLRTEQAEQATRIMVDPFEPRGTSLLPATPKPAPKPVSPAALPRVDVQALF